MKQYVVLVGFWHVWREKKTIIGIIIKSRVSFALHYVLTPLVAVRLSPKGTQHHSLGIEINKTLIVNREVTDTDRFISILRIFNGAVDVSLAPGGFRYFDFAVYIPDVAVRLIAN